jgi:hypothetical protein
MLLSNVFGIDNNPAKGFGKIGKCVGEGSNTNRGVYFTSAR